MQTNDSQAPLAGALAEVDAHLAAGGWNQPPRLFALVKTVDLIQAEPALAKTLGITAASRDDDLTPVEQEALPIDQPLDETLARIAWPPEVLGCALAHEVLALPPSAEAEIQASDEANLVGLVAAHPSRREVRIVVGVLRDGSRASILRVRATTSETADDVARGENLAPRLADALDATLGD